MDLKLRGKRALVMGSSTGLGKAIAQALIAEGVEVAICARDAHRLEQTAREINAALAIPADLSQAGAACALVEKVNAKWGGIDILVTNTGGPPKGKFDEISYQAWSTGFQGLWMSAVDAIQSVLPHMKKNRWGRVLLVTSVAAKEPMAGLTVSNGLRAGLLGLMKSLSFEVAADNITVNALLPGYTDTERLQELKVPKEKMAALIPAGRIGSPEDFGSVTAFLASEQAGYITGQAIVVDGGYSHGI